MRLRNSLIRNLEVVGHAVSNFSDQASGKTEVGVYYTGRKGDETESECELAPPEEGGGDFCEGVAEGEYVCCDGCYVAGGFRCFVFEGTGDREH